MYIIVDKLLCLFCSIIKILGHFKNQSNIIITITEGDLHGPNDSVNYCTRLTSCNLQCKSTSDYTITVQVVVFLEYSV